MDIEDRNTYLKPDPSTFGEGNGNPLQCSCLEDSKDRGAWWAMVHVITESDMAEYTAHGFRMALCRLFFF